MISILAAGLLAIGSTAAVPANLVATVNDARSHGVVGDAVLSLDEAIRLANGTLMSAMLSAAEMAQLSGAGMMVDCIVIDPAMTPVITLEGPLTDVMGMMMPGMPMLQIQGMAMGGGMPILDGGSHARILTLRTHMVQVMGLMFRGGQVGLDVRTMMGSMTPGGMAMVKDCEFEAQTVAGVKVHAAGTGETTAAMICRNRFRSMPVGILIDDQSNMGGVMTEDEFLDFDGVSVAYDIVGNGRLNLSMNMVFRSRMRNGDRFIRLVRGAQSSQQHMVRVVHCDAIAAGHVIDVQGTNAGLTMVHHHHSRLQTSAGNFAFRAVPRTALFDLHGSENTFVGDVTLSGNLFTQRIWHQTNVYQDCTFRLDNDGALANLLWNRFQGGAVDVPAAARTPCTFRSCEFHGTAITGNSALGGIRLAGCYRSNGSLTGAVTEANIAPAPFLGLTSVEPTEVPIGSSVALRANLPFGYGLVWDIAISYPRPNTSAEPYRFYGDPATVTVLPGLVVFQSRLDIPVPNNPVLVGLEFYAQGLTLPLLGQSHAPAVHLPAGGLIRPTL